MKNRSVMDAYGVIRMLGLAALLTSASVHCAKVHELMTDDEIANLFHTTRYNIPEYEVVSVRHNRHKRSDPNLRLRFNAFGKKIDAYLNPSDGILAGRNTPVWLAYTKPDGKIEYKKMGSDIVGIVAGFYDNPTNRSTVIVSEVGGVDNPSFEGTVDDMQIRPLPARLQAQQRFKRKVMNMSEPLVDTHHHVVIKSSLTEEQQKLKEMDRQIREASLSNKTDSSKVNRSATLETKEIIYPSLLINTDYKGSDRIDTKNDLAYYDEIMYQLAFWNGVDLRYRHLENPKIRLRIAGIIIGYDRTATPYMNNHRSGEVVNMADAWPDMEKYWGRMSKRADFPVEAYDVVVTMTNYDMTSRNENGYTKRVAGLGTMRGLCGWHLDEEYYALVVIQDHRAFDGILTAAHELGHIMGLDHDESSGDECDKSYGYIMQPSLKATLKNLEWSPCSMRSLSYFLRQPRRFCADQPADFHPPGDSVVRHLPGDLADPHRQCQARGYDWACEPYPEMCTHMNCYYSGWGIFWGWWCKNSGPAAEGTVCAPGHQCVDGACQCLSEKCLTDKKQ